MAEDDAYKTRSAGRIFSRQPWWWWIGCAKMREVRPSFSFTTVGNSGGISDVYKATSFDPGSGQ